MKHLFLLFATAIYSSSFSQTWVDSLDYYARESYKTPQQYTWTWQNAALLHAIEIQYELFPERQDEYLEYVRIAMDRNLLIANGIFPNGVASGNGMAFMHRITGEQKYIDAAYRVLNDYNNIIRTSNGGVSHIAYAPELWDDTVYMIGVYLLAMYRATGNEQFLDEIISQIKLHQEKLKDNDWGLWVHGWDGNNVYDIDFCSEPDWADPVTRRSHEIWGRGNGWVVVTLSEILKTIDETHEEYEFIANSLVEMIENLPDLQDESTGHWYQLPVKPNLANNYLESSCTAMFGYGILTAMQHDLVSGDTYKDAVERAYYGLRENSIIPLINHPNKPYLTTTNVAKETCIGDEDYYININIGNGKTYALAVNIIFGRAFEEEYFYEIPTSVLADNHINSIKIYPSVLASNQLLNIAINAKADNHIRFEIIDIMGRTIHQNSNVITIGSQTEQLDISMLNKGQYFLSVKGNAGEILKQSSFLVQ